MMELFDWETLRHALQGECRGVAGRISGVDTDTRQLRPGALFVALAGERFDGHAFVAQAAELGASAALVSRWVENCALPQLKVHDTRQALGLLGKLNRERFSGPVIAVTGSSGKTTVKEMIAAILRTRGPALATQGNLNNEIGVPLTLLRLAPEHRAAVVELGASAAGEIAWTVSLTQPQVAVLNNVSGAHLQGFGSLEGVARAKSEIITGLGPQGVAVLNADDPFIEFWQTTAGARKTLLFSLADKPQAAFRAQALQADEQGRYRFELVTPDGVYPIRLPLAGRHNVANALAAAAACWAAGVSLAEIQQGLAQVDGIQGRLQFYPGLQGATLIDDSYNANPGSVQAAIDVLADNPGERVLVLGEMAELGEAAAEAHRQIGEYARQRGIERLLTVGALTRHCVAGFGEGGVLCDDQTELITRLRALATPHTHILVKGSRSARMERIVHALQAQEGS